MIIDNMDELKKELKNCYYFEVTESIPQNFNSIKIWDNENSDYRIIITTFKKSVVEKLRGE